MGGGCLKIAELLEGTDGTPCLVNRLHNKIIGFDLYQHIYRDFSIVYYLDYFNLMIGNGEIRPTSNLYADGFIKVRDIGSYSVYH